MNFSLFFKYEKTYLGTTCKESTICISEKRKQTVLRTIFNNV